MASLNFDSDATVDDVEKNLLIDSVSCFDDPDGLATSRRTVSWSPDAKTYTVNDTATVPPPADEEEEEEEDTITGAELEEIVKSELENLDADQAIVDTVACDQLARYREGDQVKCSVMKDGELATLVGQLRGTDDGLGITLDVE